MCRSGTQVELPRRLAMSQVGLVGDHTLHQPCVQSLSFKSTLALWMPAHWTPSLWPTVAIPQRKKWHLPGGRITSGDLPLRTHARTHTHTHTNMLIIIYKTSIVLSIINAQIFGINYKIFCMCYGKVNGTIVLVLLFCTPWLLFGIVRAN